MPRVLILGTGTAVGKTYVTESLARALTAAGAEVRARKPIETGIEPPRRGRHVKPALSDAATLDAVSTVAAQPPHPLYAFRDPVSPHLAARRERRTLSLKAVARWLDKDLHDMTSHAMSCQVIETAGGLFSPLGPRSTNLDLARALDPAVWVLVAHDGLGVLHDVRTTLLALRAVGARQPDFLVLSASRPPDASTGTNAGELPRVGLPKPVAVVSARGKPSELAPLARALLKRSP